MPNPHNAPTFEYKTLRLDSRPDLLDSQVGSIEYLESALNELGAYGWEMVGVVVGGASHWGVRFIFKRPL